MVASSDMNHYESDEITRRKDGWRSTVLALDPRGLYEMVRREGITMCGMGPAVSMLTAARLLGATQASLVRYATSGDINGDRDEVVGYAGVIVDYMRIIQRRESEKVLRFDAVSWTVERVRYALVRSRSASARAAARHVHHAGIGGDASSTGSSRSGSGNVCWPRSSLKLPQRVVHAQPVVLQSSAPASSGPAAAARGPRRSSPVGWRRG